MKRTSVMSVLVLVVAFGMAWLTVCPVGAEETRTESAGGSAEYVPMEGTYKIGRGDVLEIHVWREPVLTRETFVRMDGMISLPLLDDIQAAGRTPMELKREIQARLSEFIEAPEVTVILKTAASQKFYMIGEIRSPGEYDLTKGLTALQAFALGGGFTEWADKDKILLLRRSQGQEQRILINYKDIVKGKNPEQNLLIEADDTIIVP